MTSPEPDATPQPHAALDPAAAVAYARQLLADDPRSRGGAGGLIAQAGLDRADRDLLWEAVYVLREATVEVPDDSQGWYNLGNALQGLSSVDATREPERYLKTRDLRREGHRALVQAGRLRKRADIATQALTNLGNWLSTDGRWSEAHQAYRDALTIDPANGAAAGNLALLLRRRARTFPKHRDQLVGLAAEYARLELKHRDKTLRYGGPAAADIFDRLPRDGSAPSRSEPADAYTRWIATNMLALTLTIEGLPSGPRWDDILIARLRRPMDSSSEVPALFAMVNVLKQDFLLARKLAFEALCGGPSPDNGLYADTLDYARYGSTTATLTLAQRAALDLLDRIAVLMNDYLIVGLKSNQIQFRTFWTSGPEDWREPLRDELTKGNRNLLALADLAFDLEKGGYLAGYRELRHTGTHRFIVLHDLEAPSAPSTCIEHLPVSEFESQLLGTLRVARAALLYAVDLINQREHRLSHEHTGPVARLHVPAHHEIRGDPS